MKFVCSKSSLIDAVSTVSRAVRPTCQVEILNCILLSAEDGKVTLRGFDLEVGMEVSIEDVDVIKNGITAVSPKMLKAIAEKMGDDELTLEVVETHLVISSGSTKMKLACRSAEDYPKLPDIEDGKSVVINSTLLKDAFSNVSFAVSKDSTRITLTGVFMKCEGDMLTTVAIDGFRMAINKAVVEGSYDFSAIIPSKAVMEVLKSIGSYEGDVSISLGSAHAYFDINGTKLVTRLISGEYIDYNKIISQNCKSSVVVNRDTIYDSFDRAFLVASAEAKNVPCSVTSGKDTLNIDCTSADSVMNDVIDDIKFEGEKIDLDLNSRYMLDALKVISDDEVRIEFSGDKGPVLIKPTEGDNYLYLVLPIRR